MSLANAATATTATETSPWFIDGSMGDASELVLSVCGWECCADVTIEPRWESERGQRCLVDTTVVSIKTDDAIDGAALRAWLEEPAQQRDIERRLERAASNDRAFARLGGR